MIRKLGDILDALRRVESAKLNESKIRHGPTIGAMYEGLTRSLLERSVPESMGLRVVSGFVTDGRDRTSGQIDCMLVSGEGEQVPYANGVYKWHVRDVLAVFEVKKNLFADELSDAHSQLLQVTRIYSEWYEGVEDEISYDLGPSRRAFAECVGSVVPRDASRTMPPSLRLIWSTIATDQIAPIRVVLGYRGYRTELGLRNGLLNLMEGNLKKSDFNTLSLHNLYIAEGASLVKMSGHPYLESLDGDGWWPLVSSTRSNPAQLILELLWTRISHHRSIETWFGDDLEVEGLSRLLDVKPQERSHGSGDWIVAYRGIQATSQQLSAVPTAIEWEPIELDADQYTVVNALRSAGSVSLTDPDVLAMLSAAGKEPRSFFDSLVGTSLVASDGDQVILTAVSCKTARLSDGRLIAAENNTGRLDRWLERRERR